MKETLAVARNVGFGNRDTGSPCLFFDTYVSEHGAALQVLTGDRAIEVIRATGVYDVKELEGRPCWVDTSDRGVIRFLRFWEKGS